MSPGIKWHDVACHHEKPIICEDEPGHLRSSYYKIINIIIAVIVIAILAFHHQHHQHLPTATIFRFVLGGK